MFHVPDLEPPVSMEMAPKSIVGELKVRDKNVGISRLTSRFFIVWLYEENTSSWISMAKLKNRFFVDHSHATVIVAHF